MKISELSFGDRFLLNRNGESYTLCEKYFWQGKPTSRFVVKPDNPHWMDNLNTIKPSLNHQCEVTKIS